MNKNIAILGASPKQERYSNMTQKLLLEKGFNVFPVNPNYHEIDEITCYEKIANIKQDIGTLTVYMNPASLKKIKSEIISKNPGRIILNPGSESTTLKEEFEGAGIKVIEACTLVMLKTGQF